MVNLELYRIFAVVAKSKSITKASEILHISQPAVSKHIQNLENELNISLFKRNRYGLELTEVGEKLFSEINEAIDTLINAAQKVKDRRNINFGIQIIKLLNLYGKSIAKFYEIHSQNTVIPIHEDIDMLLEKLEQQVIDVVISKKQDNINLSKDIDFIRLGFLQDVLITNPNNPRKDNMFSKQDFKNEIIYTPRKISDTTKNIMNTLNLDEKNYRVSNNETLIDIVKTEISYGVITKEYIKKEIEEKSVVVLKTDFEIPKTEFGLYINRNNKFKELNDLINIFKEQKI